MKYLHQKLINKSDHYKKWHSFKYHRHNHWLVFVIAFFLASSVITGVWGHVIEEQNLLITQIVGMSPAQAQVNCDWQVSNDSVLQSAISSAQAGDTICLAAGKYRSFSIKGKNGQSGNPITLRPDPNIPQSAPNGCNNSSFNPPNSEHWPVCISNDNRSSGQGIKIGGGNSNSQDWSSHIVIDGLWVDQVNQGIYIQNSDTVTVNNSRITDIGQECLRFKFSDNGQFFNNTVRGCGTKPNTSNGEGIYVGSGDERGDDTHNVLVRGNDVSQTFSEGIELKNSSYNVTVEYNHVHDSTIEDGGGINIQRWESGARTTSGHVIRNNRVHNIRTKTRWEDGNGIRAGRGAKIYNNLLYDNQHAGLRIDDKDNLRDLVEVFHNTFYNNGAGPTIIADNPSYDIRNNIGPIQSGNIQAQSSLFVNASAGDFHLQSSATAAIDQGANLGITDDFDGNVRPVGSAPDIGAYEFGSAVIGSPSPTPPPGEIQGDLDKDGDVDIFDYNILVGNFGSTSCGNIADINSDCNVDIFDYNILVENFGKKN